jgi:hypothetical protein
MLRACGERLPADAKWLHAGAKWKKMKVDVPTRCGFLR